MAGSVWDWSQTAASNDDADGDINWAEGQPARTVNNSARVMMQRQAQFMSDLSARTASTGSSGTYALTTASPFTAYSDGVIVGFTANHSNTSTATLNANAIGAKSIYAAGAALVGGEIKSGGSYILVYDTALNAAAGGWHLLNPQNAKDRVINVLDYYLPSHSDHTTAIDAAFAASKASLSYDAGRLVTRAATQKPVYFPPGNYTYSGSGVSLSGSEAYVLAYTDPGLSARIKITSDVYLITTDDYVLGTDVRNFHVMGGRGMLRYTKTGENVAGFHNIEDNVFDGYTVCAISNESSDMPYWHILRNYFYGATAGGTIGVAIGGYLDSTRILYNSFCNNKYHLKVGWDFSGTVDIQHNDFIAFLGSIKTADIWFVPATAVGAVNSGFGTTVRNNKFGNENLGVNDTRILIAAEGAGADRATKVHSTTFYTTGQYVSGVSIDENRISGVSSGAAPFIKSYIENVNYLNYGSRNSLDGGTYTYLIEYMGTLGEGDAYLTRNNRFEIGASQYMARPFSAGISNYRTGLVIDPFGMYATDSGTMLHGIGDDVGYLSLATGVYSDITVFGGASKTAATDGYGGTETAEVTFASASSSNGVYVDLGTPVEDDMHWLEVDIGAGSATSVFTLGIQVINPTTGAVALRRESLTLFPSVRRVRIPFFFPDSTNPADWIATVYATDFSAGTRTKAKVARFRVYQARAPMNTDHIRTLGDGTWNTQHIVMGAFHLWVDSTGDLRLKQGAPTSDTDGTVVGTQT
jgi:hypothetical protein